MRRIRLLALGFGLAGCTGYVGPLETYRKNRVSEPVDAPGYTIDEQEKRARSRLTLVEDDPRIGPVTGISRPGGIGR